MKIKLPKQITEVIDKLAIIGKHHYFISVVLLLIGLTYAVYVVNETLSATKDDAYYQQRITESLKASFDKATIEKIQELQKSSDSGIAQPELPQGVRTNPFAE
jgi:hypothetical protein